ncbi:hypothetical protein [Phaeospirillum tilakii]|uniref:Uncharacterized protein n=1 Tax=Phaeospirillum tilakii TaxID=741673 RepID=A0ABW5C604_9PROT
MDSTEHPATLTAPPHDGTGHVETVADPTAGHTPGPWVADFPNNLVNSVAGGHPNPVCRVGWSGWRGRAEIEANAALIAAAPEMAAEIERLRAESDEACFEVETLNEKLDKARADLAAAQAENETALTCYGDRITTLEAEVIGQQEEIERLRATQAKLVENLEWALLGLRERMPASYYPGHPAHAGYDKARAALAAAKEGR